MIYWGMGDGKIMRPVTDPSTPAFIRDFAEKQEAVQRQDEQFLKACGIATGPEIEATVTHD